MTGIRDSDLNTTFIAKCVLRGNYPKIQVRMSNYKKQIAGAAHVIADRTRAVTQNLGSQELFYHAEEDRFGNEVVKDDDADAGNEGDAADTADEGGEESGAADDGDEADAADTAGDAGEESGAMDAGDGPDEGGGKRESEDVDDSAREPDKDGNDGKESD